jgi:hypothetical protein
MPGERPIAFIVKQRLKVMSESAYLEGRGVPETDDRMTGVCDQVFRDVVLPVVEEEINAGYNFAELRQLYHCIILAGWFKLRYRDHPRAGKYINSNQPGKLGVYILDVRPWGVALPAPAAAAASGSAPGDVDPKSWSATPAVARIRASPEYQIPENREYFERYLRVFEKGVFYVERDELVEGSGYKRARAYVAGGVDLRSPQVTRSSPTHATKISSQR